MICKDHTYLNRMAVWMADLDRIRDELANYEQPVLSAHLDSVSADLEFQSMEFIQSSEPEVTHRGSSKTRPRRVDL